MEQESNNKALIDYFDRRAPVEILHLQEQTVPCAAVVPEGRRVADLKPLIDSWRAHPERARGTAQIGDIASFIDFVNRTKLTESVIFASNSRKEPSLVAVFDYNAPNDGTPGWGQHRAEHVFPLSDEWKQWVGGNKRLMKQAEFAEWIEDRILDVADPSLATDRTKEILNALGGELPASPAKLLALSKGLTVHVQSQLENHVKLDSGEVNLVWKTEHQDGQGSKLVVPGAFLVAVPLFQGGPKYPIIVRLKYRAGQGAVEWSYALYRTEEFFDLAIAESCKQVREQTNLPVYVGIPEAAVADPESPEGDD